MLTAEEYKYVLTVECPPKPNDDAEEGEIEAYKKWIKADEMARCYILASMSGVLQHQHQAMSNAYDMMLNLKELFGHQNRAARKLAMKILINTRMAEGTPVRDHMLLIMAYLNELEILGAEIDAKSQIDIILLTLPDRFEPFQVNYNMNKRLYSLAELMIELQSAESLFR